MNNKLITRIAWIFLAALFWSAASLAQAAQVEGYDGKNNAAVIEQHYGLSKNRELTARIEGIGQALVAASEHKDVAYSFKVLGGKNVNALSCPGNVVFIFKGLIDLMPSDAELAGAIAHELAHLGQGHVQRRSGNVASGIRAKIGQEKIDQDREHEYQADAGGFKLALKAGFNPYGIFVTVSKLAVEDGKMASRSHPSVLSRLEQLDALAKSENIQPLVRVADSIAYIETDGWQLAIKQPAAGYTAVQRAWLLAGNLYIVQKQRSALPGKFSCLLAEERAEIFYNGALFHTVHGNDLRGSGFLQLDELAGWHMEQFRAFERLGRGGTRQEGMAAAA